MKLAAIIFTIILYLQKFVGVTKDNMLLALYLHLDIPRKLDNTNILYI